MLDANAIRPFITEDPVQTYQRHCNSVPTLFAFADMVNDSEHAFNICTRQLCYFEFVDQ